MHDLLEGVLNLEIDQLLSVFVTKKKMSLKVINERLQFFDFGSYEQINKSQDIAEEHLRHRKLKYSA